MEWYNRFTKSVMEEISLSVMRNTQQTEPVLRRLLDQFERESGIRVHLQMLAWETARQDVKTFAIHQRGPDVSAMATTWVTDLVSMNALQALDSDFLHQLGGAEDFIPSSWDAVRVAGEKQFFAIPWLVDTYVIHYRGDLFEQAGIDDRTAFNSTSQIETTVQRLSQAGVPVAIQLPFYYDPFCAMHTLAAWVWAHGGKFSAPDGSRVLFDQPEALAGMKDYFNLLRYLSPEARQRLSDPSSAGLFRQGQAAMAFGTFSFMYDLDTVAPLIRDNWHVASLPEPHFVGGVNLVHWKYSIREEASHKLIRFLNSPEVVSQCANAMLTLPARLSVLESPAFMEDPILSVFTHSARTGRSYPPVRLWGLIEERFIQALQRIVDRSLQEPGVDLSILIPEVIQPVARRLNLTLTK